MQVELAVDIAAPPEKVWQALIAVERWPEWTRSMTSLQRLEAGPFKVGSEALVWQPRLPKFVWRVTEFEPGRSFTWKARSWGAITVASHRITPQLEGSRVELAVHQKGPLVSVFGPWISKLTRRYMDMEAQGLKRRCEGVAVV